jgi:hypothetical protein
MLRVIVDTDTKMEKCAYLSRKVTVEDASVVTKGCHARVDIDFDGVTRVDSGDGSPVWRPRLRVAKIHVMEGVGEYTRPGMPPHNSQINEPDNVSTLNYRGTSPTK